MILSSLAQGQSVPFDVNADGRSDRLHWTASDTVIVAADDGQPLSVFVAPHALSAWGWTVIWHPLPDHPAAMLVSAPLHALGPDKVGSWTCVDAASGDVLWFAESPTNTRGGLGTVLLPDHDGDGVADVAAQVLRRDAASGNYVRDTVILSGASGKIRGPLHKSLKLVIDQAASGSFVTLYSDLDMNDVVSDTDVEPFVDAFIAAAQTADVNSDLVVDTADIEDFATSLAASLSLPHPNGASIPTTLVLAGELDRNFICPDLDVSIDILPGGDEEIVVYSMFLESESACDESPCSGCMNLDPLPGSGFPPIRVEAACSDARVQAALNDPRVQAALAAAQASCAAQSIWQDRPCQTKIHIACSPSDCSPWTEPRLPPRMTLCVGTLLPGQLGTDMAIEMLIHELTHIRQLCDYPDKFYGTLDEAICNEIEAYCAQPSNQFGCSTPSGRCNLACQSAQSKVRFKLCRDEYAVCVSHCLGMEGQCQNGHYPQ
ncbi:MAG: hypothetical protein ACK5ZG_01460 [Phycisphaerae bacterium]